MQTSVLKQTSPNQFVSLALVLGLAVSIVVNVALLTRSDDDAAPAIAPQVVTVNHAARQRYGDWLQRQAGQRAGPAAWGQSTDDRAYQIEEQRASAEHAARMAAWGQFLEERNARNDASALPAGDDAAGAAAESVHGYAGISPFILDQMFAEQDQAPLDVNLDGGRYGQEAQ